MDTATEGATRGLAAGLVAGAAVCAMCAMLATLATWATWGATGASAGGSRRFAEAVVLSGSDLAPFVGTPASRLQAWWLDTDGSWERLASQVDQRGANGLYVGAEQGALGANDELVFPLPLYSVAPANGELPDGIDADAPWARVEIVDPLQDGVVGSVTVLASTSAPGALPEPDVTWDATTREVRSPSYVLGFADPMVDGFVGFSRLTLHGASQDLIDRLKLRLTATLGNYGDVDVTEETLALLGVDVGALSPRPVVRGPVRVVLDATGAGMAYRDRVQFRLTLFEGISLPGGYGLKSGRVSLDLSQAALGSTYRDSNTVTDVAVDGVPDVVPERPLPAWRELQTPEGPVVILRRPLMEAPTASVYWKDDNAVDADDTGDGRSIGDQGVRADTLTDLVDAGFPGEIVFPPADGGFSADTLAENAARPVAVAVTFGRVPPTATVGPTAPPTATPSSRPSATAVAQHAVFLSFALKSR